MTGGQANFLQSLGWAIINSLWQLALLWVIYQLITAIFKSAKPAAKAMLASSLLMTGFAWFIFTFILAFTEGNHNTAPFSTGIMPANGINSWLIRSLPFASVLYLLLLFIPLLRFIRNYRYIQVIRRYGLTKMDPEWRVFVNKISAMMGITKPVRVWVSEWVSSPVTFGFLKPVILVPLAAINNLSPSQMEAVLLHELSHIRRYDYLVNFILNIIRVVLYFNPFAKAFVRIVEREREKSCDEMVLQFQYDSRDYATALLQLEKLSYHNRILVLPSTGNNKDLLQRVETILGVGKKRSLQLRRLAGMLAGLFCVFCLNALLVITKTTAIKTQALAQSPEPQKIDDGKYTAALIEQPRQSIQNLPTKSKTPAKQFPVVREERKPFIEQPGIINADYQPVQEVLLDKFEEVQVKQAMEASKKVLENEQWKNVEKNLADVFNQEEKEELRTAWKTELNKFDWKKWEDKLRLAYNQVDWEKVNVQLNDAISKMQVDSLVRVYSNTIAMLSNVKKELNSECLNGIPDTDITLKELADKQRQMQKAIINLKATRIKKIVHL